MISRNEYNLYVNCESNENLKQKSSNSLCYMCRKQIGLGQEKFWLGHREFLTNISYVSYLYFHRSCFEAMAGQNWIIEPK